MAYWWLAKTEYIFLLADKRVGETTEPLLYQMAEIGTLKV